MQGSSLRTLLLVGTTIVAIASAACTKSEGPSTTSEASAPSASAPAMMASAAPDASPMAADTTTGDKPTGGADADTPTMASASASASASATPSASGSAGAGKGGPLAAANAACGTKPQPDCPLQSWMKKNTNPAVAAGDLPAVATALDQIVTYAPPGYGNWASISKDGAKAARAGDMTAAKASCRTCHDQYKAKYKAELRGRKI